MTHDHNATWPHPIRRTLTLVRQMGWSDAAFLVFITGLLTVGLVRELLGLPMHRPIALASMATLAVIAGFYVLTAVRRRQQLGFFREATQKTPSAFALYDDKDRLIASNEAYEAVHRIAFDTISAPITYEKLVRATLSKSMTGAEKDTEYALRMKSHNEATGIALDRRYPNGRWLRVIKARTKSGANVGVGIDVTELYDATALADREHSRFRGVAETLPVGIWHFDATGRTIFVNQHLLTFFGLNSEQDLHSVSAPEFLAAHVDGFDTAIAGADQDDLGNMTIRDRNGGVRHVIMRTSELPADAAGNDETIVSFVDVTALKDTERRIEYLAHRDTLTDTRNRAAFMKAIEIAADNATPDNPCWLLVMDLDGFKPVNDRYGHAAGDMLLRVLANRVQKVQPAGSHLYRLGGDEFCLVVQGSSRDAMEDVAKALLATVARPFQLDNAQVNVTMSIGIAAMPIDTEQPEIAQRYADLALYSGKKAGGGVYVFFTREHADHELKERVMTLDLSRAIADDEFSLVFQPVFTRSDRRVMGAEALLRWTNRRTGQSVAPGEFIPTAERAGIIGTIDMWVLRRVAEQLSDWRSRGVDVPLAMINMSPPTLEEADFLPRLDRILAKYPSIRGHICMEITEGVVIQDRERLGRTFEELKSRGIRTAIDDFGTGQTSVALLRDLPVSFIKIDRSYIEGIETDPQTMAIVSTLIQLGRELDVEIIGEGVETQAQLAALDRAGCQLIQGFLWARPASAADLENLVGPTAAAPEDTTDRTTTHQASDRLP